MARPTSTITPMTAGGEVRAHYARIVFRGMKEDGGAPAIGPHATTLGVRDCDISTKPSGEVEPGTGGMSVSPDDPTFLPSHRRPASFGGTGKLAVWSLEVGPCDSALNCRPETETHHLVEPYETMSRERYIQLIESTGPRWRFVAR